MVFNYQDDILDFYKNQLLLGFYRKRGKSVVVPHVIHILNRLCENNTGRVIRVLDIGCGTGDLLHLIQGLSKHFGCEKKLELSGLDCNRKYLDEASSKLGSDVTLIHKDLRYDLLDEYKNQFDLVISINTLHEVFTSLIGEEFNGTLGVLRKIEVKMSDLITQMAGFLSNDGSMILYDGLDIPMNLRDKKIMFKIKNVILSTYFDKFINEYKPWKIEYKNKNEIYTMKYRDFARFISTFKYLNTSLWPIESRESYLYFSKQQFRAAFNKTDLIIETELVMNNDLGLWKEYVEIISDQLDFPQKSIMIIGSKKYVPSKYDYIVG